VRRDRLVELWDRTWFRPASPLGLIATRTLVTAHALWIVLSRPDLPDLVAWPREFWLLVPPLTRIRFGILGSPPGSEQALWVLLHVALGATLLGVRPRVSCLLSAVLLYHFAPFEEIIVGMPHTFFGGLTLAVLALFVLAFAEVPHRGQAASPEFRWPVALIQLLFCLNYFVAALAKLYNARGLGWFTGDTIRDFALGHWAMTAPPWALWVAERPLVCWGMALGTALLELLFPLAVVSPRAAAVLVPCAVVFHFAIVKTLRIFFPSWPLLLLFVDWDRLARWSRWR
jgi:hypothetical protein